MSILILTEKPSVAKDIAAAFKSKPGDGFIYCEKNDLLGDDVSVTWAFGHLLQIANDFPKGLTITDLPVLPDFNYEPTESGKKQLGVIRKLLSSATKVIVATDSGREGELIARLILNHCSWNNWDNTFRFWTSEALTLPVVEKTLRNLKPAVAYDGLYQSAIGRQHSDWIVGLNLSAATGMMAKGFYSVGRVQTPTLKLIEDRNQSIKSFVPVTYYTVELTFDQKGSVFQGALVQKEDLQLTIDQANEIINSLKKETSGSVVSVIAEEKKTAPPVLHSLTSLQREANDKYGYSASDTLEIAQDLYEKLKAISYPRTDSNHMSESSLDLVVSVVESLGLACDRHPSTIGKRLFDDSKLTDHHAIIPLKALPESSTEKQRNIYGLILRRFHGSFLNDLVQKKTTVLTSVSEESFKTTGTQLISSGWKKLHQDEDKKEEKLLPTIVEGVCSITDFVPAKHITEAPKKHTESSLLAVMEKLGLGTPATRASIIEKLLSRTYIVRDKKNLITTDKGSQLISLVSDRDFADAELTASWENKLGEIAANKFTYSDFVREIKTFTTAEIEVISKLTFVPTESDKLQATPKMIDFAKSLAKQHGQKITATDSETIRAFIDKWSKTDVKVGACSCGQEIKDSLKSYNCSCGKILWKESYGRKFSKDEAAKLFAGQNVSAKNLKKKDSKVTYGAVVRISPESKKLEIVEFLK